MYRFANFNAHTQKKHALWYNVSLCTALQAVTTLVSMMDTTMVDTNVDAVLRPLTEKEREVQEEIEKSFFQLLPQRHWEGVELKEYWQAMKTEQ